MAHWMLVLAGIQLILSLGVYYFGITFVGGTRGAGWLGRLLPRTIDFIQERFSWRRMRIQRDFATLLALLLDSGVPEDKALALAGAGTGSLSFQRRAEQTAENVRQGIKLTEAVQSLDSNGEVRWRLENAIHGGGPCGFAAALNGWRESLDARAYQKEQAGAQCIATVLLFLNAALIALVALAVFSAVFSLSSVTY
jgi:type II secretory pathway component PulF